MPAEIDSVVDPAAQEGPDIVTKPAWRDRRSCYLVATDDRMIPPPVQRAMAERAGATTVETPGSHAIYVSNPPAVADLIKRAAAGR